jgi:DNA uptake protein ComE-like DNA-binding protein
LLKIWALILLAVVGIALSASAAEFPIDLNRASLEEIKELPISGDVALAIYEHREYRAFFNSIYDLMKVPGIDPMMLETLKPLVRIEPVEENEVARRMNIAQRMVRAWGSSESTNEGLIDMWIDIAKDPPNINTADIYDLMNMQNVSPVDAVAIVNHRNAIGTYRSRRDLRYTPGLSGWGYYNLRSLIKYEDKARGGDLHGTYQLRVKAFGYYSDTVELLKQDVMSAQNVYDSWWDRLSLDNVRPAVAHKVYLKYFLSEQTAARIGLHVYKRWGEIDYDTHLKGFVAFEDFGFGDFKVDKVVFGTFLAGWGQGLVMENSDYFKARKSGYSWDKRYYGVLGDVSRTDTYKHKGIGLQFSWNWLKGIGFFSNDWKDAVINKDGSVFAPVIMTPSVENDVLDEYALLPIRNVRAGIARDVLHEKTYGGNLRFVYAPGSHVGVSGYESRYNRNFDPMMGETFIAREDKITAVDNEIFSMYRSPGKYRRIHGLEWQHVYKNFCAQMEYAEMHIDGSVLKLGDDPKAFVASLWTQYNNLHFLALFRNHDLGFDNPYSRGFSNYRKFRGTILEDFWYLKDPMYGMLAVNSPAPQAERGFYITTRYRLTNNIIPSLEYDRWTRLADGAGYSRFIGKLEWRFLHPLRFKIRQQWQGRHADNSLTPMSYHLDETRIELEMRLSNYNMVEFMYIRGGTGWPPRPRLVGNVAPDGGHPVEGQAFMPNNSILMRVIHNFNDKFNMSLGAIAYDGFVWYFEESEFMPIDGRNSVKVWINFQERISDRLWLEIKAAWDRGEPLTNVDIRQYNQPYGNDIDYDFLVGKHNYFRIQLDYIW